MKSRVLKRSCAYVVMYSFLFIALYSAVDGKGNISTATNYYNWNRTLWERIHIDSYLFNHTTMADAIKAEPVKDFMRAIHWNQHPVKSQCHRKRLLVLHMKTTSLEGFGSVMKTVMFGLAVAMHSNRTLILGTGLPFMFEHTQNLWLDNNYDQVIGDYKIECANTNGPGGGPFNCFFQPFSTCSLVDASPSELRALSENQAYNDDARLMLLDITQVARKSVALFHAPYGLLQHILQAKKYRNAPKKFARKTMAKSGYIWAAAVTAYGFRLKPRLAQAFYDKGIRSLPSLFSIVHHGTTEGLWSVHVRHGDVKKMHEFIQYKKVYKFENYFAAARELSHAWRRAPRVLYIATDSTQADSITERYRTWLNKISTNMNWFGGSPPPLVEVVADAARRYRTSYGFLLGARGGCVRDSTDRENVLCHAPYEDVLRLEIHERSEKDEDRRVSHAVRMMLLFIEAIEDVYLLSLSESVLGTGSSHFGTMAALLVMARTGASSVKKSVYYLDYEYILAGSTPTAYLHGTNLQSSSYNLQPDEPGVRRWEIHTRRFVGGLKSQESKSETSRRIEASMGQGRLELENLDSLWGEEKRMRMRGVLKQKKSKRNKPAEDTEMCDFDVTSNRCLAPAGLKATDAEAAIRSSFIPQISADVFYREALSWLPRHSGIDQGSRMLGFGQSKSGSSDGLVTDIFCSSLNEEACENKAAIIESDADVKQGDANINEGLQVDPSLIDSWPGQCPRDAYTIIHDDPQYLIDQAVALAHLGEEHYKENHRDQAWRCWWGARALLSHVTRLPDRRGAIVDIAGGAMGAIEGRQESLAELVEKSIRSIDENLAVLSELAAGYGQLVHKLPSGREIVKIAIPPLKETMQEFFDESLGFK